MTDALSHAGVAEGSNAVGDDRPVIVVLVDEDSPHPTPLLKGIARRGLATELTPDAARIMTVLADRRVKAMVITEPRGRAHLDDLREAVARSYPHVAQWWYESSGEKGRPTLARFEEHPVGATMPWQQESGDIDPLPLAPSNAVPPTARTSGQSAAEDPIGDIPDQAPEGGGQSGPADPCAHRAAKLVPPTLSPEEIAMLLGSELNDPPVPMEHADGRATKQSTAKPTAAVQTHDLKSRSTAQSTWQSHDQEHATLTPEDVDDSAVPGEPAAEMQLGDVDLIEQILIRAPDLRQTLLKVLTQRTGITEAGLANPQQVLPGDRSHAPIEFQGRRLGVLHAPAQVGADLLQPWATWMSRWLALAGKIDELWRLAMTDDLTGLWNRRYFNVQLAELLDRARTERFRVTLMLFDIDDFKGYNDRYGHAAGDQILCEIGQLMGSCVRRQDVVARVGGDEFAVIFWDAEEPRRPNSHHPHDVAEAARRFQHAICEHRFPKLLEKIRDTITISGGLAGYPWDGRTSDELFELADTLTRQSKLSGKNVLTFGPGALGEDPVVPE